MDESSSDGLSLPNKNTYSADLTHWLRLLKNNDEKLSANSILIAEFDRYLHSVAGLVKTTRVTRCRNARKFLNWLASSGSTQVSATNLTHFSSFMQLHVTQVSVVTTAGIATLLNSFIRFLSACGYCKFATATRVNRPKLLHRTPSNKSLNTADLISLLDSFRCPIDYVLHAWPKTEAKHLFVYHRAPLGRSIKAKTIRCVDSIEIV